MKKVLALVLAVIMVCTMAMAVDVTTTTTPSGTSAGPYAVAKPGTSLEVAFNETTDGIHFYLNKDGKFVPANNVVTVTFAKGGELVASQGWVKTGTGDTAGDYQYFINLKQDLNRVADTKVADIQISAITFKSTGYDLVKVFAPTSAADYKSFAYGYNNVNVVLQEDGTVSFNPGEVTTIASLLDKNGKEVNSLNVKVDNMTYSFVKGQKVYSALAADITAPATTVTPVATYQNLLNTTAKVVYEKGVNADTTYRVYAKGADGSVVDLGATFNANKVLTATATLTGPVIVTDKAITATAASTGTTTNPGTGANDVVGVAAALAVVALVSGAAISLKK